MNINYNNIDVSQFSSEVRERYAFPAQTAVQR